MKKILILSVACLMGALTMTSCSDNDSNSNEDTEFNVVTTAPIVDQDSYAALSRASYEFGSKKYSADGAIDRVLELISYQAGPS